VSPLSAQSPAEPWRAQPQACDRSIFLFHPSPATNRVAYETLSRGLRTLESAVRTGEYRVIVDVLRNFVPTFQPGTHLTDDEVVLATHDGEQPKRPITVGRNGNQKQPDNGHADTPADKVHAAEAVSS